MLHALRNAAYVIHIGGGFVGLVSGSVALLVRKGGRLHRLAGNIFFVSMLLMAAFAIDLAIVIPGELVNVFIGIFALYLVGTAWLTVRRRAGTAGRAETFAVLVSVCLCAPFAILAFQLAAGLPPLFTSSIAFEGPVLIALYVFTAVLVTAAVTDARVVAAGGIAGAPRIARHLWRMCLGLTLAAGSGFTNGFARLLPGPYYVPPAFFLPQFVPLGFMVFWMIKVRKKGLLF
jgi:uncharacterized membrane protein